MYALKELLDSTTHVVIAFTEQNNCAGKLQVELVPFNWVYSKGNKWWSLYPAANEYENLDDWCKNIAPPKRNWKSHKIEILSQCKNYAEGMLKLKQSYTRMNIDDSSTTGGESEIDGKKPYEQVTKETQNLLDDIPT